MRGEVKGKKKIQAVGDIEIGSSERKMILRVDVIEVIVDQGRMTMLGEPGMKVQEEDILAAIENVVALGGIFRVVFVLVPTY